VNQAAQAADRAFGRYHIVKPLKIGGTAAIYLAVMRGENNFSREVVIKRPLPHLVADQRARLMFVDEAHIASRLAHPNICQVLDLVAREDELYLVLEYLRGVDLREILKRCIQLGVMMPPEVAVYIAIEVCSGLDFAHEASGVDGGKLGIVHRDVSPKNIRITDSGSVKIIDFGIARALGRATETAVGTIKGTLGYMSPEQILGDDIDKRSDVFAFGICLFQMLTCRNPFDGPSLKERVRRLTQAPIPPVREFNASLDEEIEGIVMKCLERDLDQRYQRLRDTQMELDRYLARLQVVSPRQRLIRFLEEIFPSLHEADNELKVALTEVSNISGKIDTDQRLVFPDDPPTQSNEQRTRPTMSSSTASTEPAAGDTKPVVRRPEGGSDASQIATEVESSPPAVQKGTPLRLIGAALVAVSVAAVLTIQFFDHAETKIESAPIALPIEPPETKDQVAVPPVTPPPPPKVEPPPRRVEPPLSHPPPPAAVAREDARFYFLTGARLEREGKIDEARLLYLLAYDLGGKRPDSAIYRNLGLLYNGRGEVPKAKACLSAYLANKPAAPDAGIIRNTIASFPATETVSCVSPKEIASARTRHRRQGTKIESWVQETRKQRLQ
jgi:serine/threonine protein kinase